MATNIWNPFLETLPLDKLRELRFRRFKRLFVHAYNNSPFYRKRYRQAGVDVEVLKSPEDIRNIPIISKEDFRDEQTGVDPFPYGGFLAVPIEEVTAFHQTTGTTGKPVRFGDTWEDWERYTENWAMMMYSRGLRQSDRVYVPFPYHLFIAFWGGHYGAEKLGAEVVAGGQTSTEQRVVEMKELRCTAMMSTPTYALRMAEVASRIGIDPQTDIPIRMIFCTGEPGASIPATRRRIENAWNARVYDHCGATEAPLWAYECEARDGMHLNEANFIVEILDPATFEPVSPGEIGTVVVTNLGRRAMPIIRFDLKDLTRLPASYVPCPCGRSWTKIVGGILGRRDDIIKVRGVLFSPASVEQVVRSTPQLGDEYEILVTQENEYDRILVLVEVLPEYLSQREELERLLVRELRKATQLRCEVEFRDFGSLTRYEGKSKRLRNLRKAHSEKP